MKTFDVEERVEKALDYFNSGYNCAQSVFLAYCDLFDLDMETASKMTVSFGGGIGRMREVCGTVSAMAMLAGFRYPVTDPSDTAMRTRNYAVVQRMAALFRESNQSINCRDLLKHLTPDTRPKPSVRSAGYYAKRPCGRFVVDAAFISGQMLKGELEEKDPSKPAI